MTRADASVVRLTGVGVRRGAQAILAEVDWSVEPGQRWVVLGPNGAGKTTLLRIATGYLFPSDGEAALFGQRLGTVDVRAIRPRIGLAGAALDALVRPERTPLELVLTGARGTLDPWWDRYTDDDRARAMHLLDRLRCGRLADHAYATLSSGERQRTLIARALMPDPDLLVLDEPFAGLDIAGREDLVVALKRLAGGPRPSAIVLVVHHLEEIPPGFGHALLLAGGRVVAAGPLAAVLANEPMSRAYERPLTVARRDGRWTATGMSAPLSSPG